MTTNLATLPARSGAGSFHVVVESPRGSEVKLKYDLQLRAFKFSRPHTAPVSRFGTIRPTPNVTRFIVRLVNPALDRLLHPALHFKRAGGNAMTYDTDVIVVGAGLAGLVAATEIADFGKRVILLDQEGEQNLGGQAFWSFGGLFLVNSPEQRRLRIQRFVRARVAGLDGAAGSIAHEDLWPKRWAEAYVDFAAGEKRAGCAPWATGFSRWSAGRNAAGTTRWAMATRCLAFTSAGAPGPAWSSRSSGARAKRRRADCSPSSSAIASMRLPYQRHGATASAARSSSRRQRRAA